MADYSTVVLPSTTYQPSYGKTERARIPISRAKKTLRPRHDTSVLQEKQSDLRLMYALHAEAPSATPLTVCDEIFGTPIDDDLDDNTPPPYADAIRQTTNERHGHRAGVYTGPAHDWAIQASRVAARTAVTRQKSRTSIHKSLSRRQKSKRLQQPFARSLRPGITIDTSVSRHRGAPPKQIFPDPAPAMRGALTGAEEKSDLVPPSALQVLDRDTKPTKDRWWSSGKSLRNPRKVSRKSRGTNERTAPTEEDIASRSESANNGFRFKARTLRSHATDRSEERPAEDGVAEDTVPELGRRPLPHSHKNRLIPIQGTPDDITPSDAPIPIGMSISPSNFTEHESALHGVTGIGGSDESAPGRPHEPSDVVPMTPTIAITPAREEFGWSLELPGVNSQHRPRAASSIYSQNTMRYTGVKVPPVPQLPGDTRLGSKPTSRLDQDHVVESIDEPSQGKCRANPRDSTATTFEEDEDGHPGDHIMSAMTNTTIFEEEEETPRVTTTRVARKPADLTIETTIPTPRRSRGWWNVITTPFEANRSNVRYMKTPTSDGEVTPDIPIISQAACIAGTQSAHQDTYHGQGGLPLSAESDVPSSSFSDMFSPTTGTPVHNVTPTKNTYPAVPAGPTPIEGADNSATHVDGTHQSTLDPARHSQYSVFSPNDREIPIALGSESDHGPLQPHSNAFWHNTDRDPSVHRPGPMPQAPNVASPAEESSRSPGSAFSPVVLGVASLGTVLSARAVGEPASAVNHPQQLSVRTVGNDLELQAAPVRSETADRVSHWPRFDPAPPAYTRHPEDVHSASRNGRNDAPRGTVRPKPRPDRTYREKDTSRRNCDCFGRRHHAADRNSRRRRRRCCLLSCLIFALLAIVALVIALTLTLTRKHKDMPVQSQWLNLTGYPPMPTGILTVARPNTLVAQSDCVSPSTMWSCAVPKEEQQSIAPNDPDQPNFRLEIRFNNGSIANASLTQPVHSKRSVGMLSTPASAGEYVGAGLLRLRDAFTDSLFIPSPSPPSLEDQRFLGSTTDNNTVPFEGEQTPFFISFISPRPLPSRVKRDASSATTADSNPFPDLTSLIPDPAIDSDGTAAPANLLPLPTSQPVRLYNRGLATEHYGFYTYYDRSIFLKSPIMNTSDTDLSPVPSDEDGGSAIDAATVRCTWAQTRFLVQIWTNRQNQLQLLPPPTSATTSVSTPTSPSASASASNSSANAFVRPGSFPYPVTITLDRHGGDQQKKLIYCYGLDARGRVVAEAKKIQLEDRGVEGVLVNPTNGPFGNVTYATKDGGPGGVDGGSGGCRCQWANWERRG